jgi:hypothetical protein
MVRTGEGCPKKKKHPDRPEQTRAAQGPISHTRIWKNPSKVFDQKPESSAAAKKNKD